MSDEVAKKPARGGVLSWIVLVLVAALAAATGAALPWVLPAREPAPKKVDTAKEKERTVVTFGEVIVNLGEDRLTRYLRVKILLVIDEDGSEKFKEHLERQKAFLKSWLIAYLSDQSMQEVSRAAGVNRIRREVRDQFNAMLFPDGAEKIYDILFDEFVVQ